MTISDVGTELAKRWYSYEAHYLDDHGQKPPSYDELQRLGARMLFYAGARSMIDIVQSYVASDVESIDDLFRALFREFEQEMDKRN